MSDSFLYSPWVRPCLFTIGLVFYLSLERKYPLRSIRAIRSSSVNIMLTIFNSVSLKLITPFVTYILAQVLSGSSIGILEKCNLSFWSKFIVSLVILDFVIYWQHRFFHNIPILWRFHKVHHSDSFFDTSTALRFHVIEILISLIIKTVVVLIFGIPLSALIVFEVLLNNLAMFNHSNFQLPPRVEKLISLFIVTPSFHRVHHSTKKEETNSNYSFCLSFWDKAFGSYIVYSPEAQISMEVGLCEFKSKPQNTFRQLLLLPFS